MAAAVGDVHRVPRCGGVEVLSGQGPALLRFRIVILEAEDPLGRRVSCGADRGFVADSSNGTEVAIDPAEIKAAGRGRVGVGIDKPGQYRRGRQIDLYGPGPPRRGPPRRRRPRGPPVRDRDGASPGPEFVDRDDVSR